MSATRESRSQPSGDGFRSEVSFKVPRCWVCKRPVELGDGVAVGLGRVRHFDCVVKRYAL